MAHPDAENWELWTDALVPAFLSTRGLARLYTNFPMHNRANGQYFYTKTSLSNERLWIVRGLIVPYCSPTEASVIK